MVERVEHISVVRSNPVADAGLVQSGLVARLGEVDSFPERADALAEVAKAGSVDEFSRRLELETKRLQGDDGMDRLACACPTAASTPPAHPTDPVEVPPPDPVRSGR